METLLTTKVWEDDKKIERYQDIIINVNKIVTIEDINSDTRTLITLDNNEKLLVLENFEQLTETLHN